MVEKGDISEVWNRVIGILQDTSQLSDQQRAYVSQASPLGELDGTVLLSVPTQFTKDFIETRVREPITSALTTALGRDARFAVTVSSEDSAPSTPSTEDSEDPVVVQFERPADAGSGRHRADNESSVTTMDPTDDATLLAFPGSRNEETASMSSDPFVQPAPAMHPSTSTRTTESSHLNPKYTFDSFVIGSSNRFAHAAAAAAAEAPARAYNPLFIYGGSGLGKTHLLHAIGHYATNLYPNLKVRYVNSEEFTNDFINSIRDDRDRVSFQRRYRTVDILLIDDIQFLQDKEATMEEFFHTFNALHGASKQIVITSDAPPKELAGFAERIRSRFEGGLPVDIQPPDLETRIAILRRVAAYDNLDVPNDVLELIASRISSNIRTLEGQLRRITAYASLNHQSVDLQLAEIILKDFVSGEADEEITASTIIGQTASYFGLTIDDLVGQDRTRVITNARQIAMYLCRELTDSSFPDIARSLGKKDHTTVIHACNKISDLLSEDRKIFNQVTELTNRIKQNKKSS